MSDPSRHYDLIAVGGGLAGLSVSILAARAGRRVLVIEKNTYPFHKLCGEYISEESFHFLETLGLPLSSINLPRIRRLQVSSPSGYSLFSPLDLGGFGLSRYVLDALLVAKARECGVTVLENTEVRSISHSGDMATITIAGQTFTGRAAVAAYGKKARPDVEVKRKFLTDPALSDRVGVKYHIRHTVAEDLIALHNFEGGYCGISRIEEGKSCLCYLTSAAALKKAGSIRALEQTVMSQNPHLKAIFENAKFLFSQPVTISNIYFGKKELYRQGIFYAGDAGGVIDPMCGNGMSMALLSGKILHELLEDYFTGNVTLDTTGALYRQRWNREFNARLLAGRLLRPVFGKKLPNELAVRSLQKLPGVTKFLTGLTHGKPF